MDLNAPIFLFLFLPIFTIAYYLVDGRAKIIIGITGSLFYYAWGNLDYVPLMMGLVLFVYFVGVGVGRTCKRLALFLLWTGILLNVALIIGFKFWPNVKYPLGLSYLTFQVIAYLFEVYSKKIDYETNLL